MLRNRQLIVEAYLPVPPHPRVLTRRIDDRLKLLQRFQATALVVVVPNGIPPDLTDVSHDPRAVVTTLANLDAAISSAAVAAGLCNLIADRYKLAKVCAQ